MNEYRRMKVETRLKEEKRFRKKKSVEKRRKNHLCTGREGLLFYAKELDSGNVSRTGRK